MMKSPHQGCGQAANMRCPTCIKLGLPAIYFCGKECFTKAWPTHKLLHTLLTSSGPCTLPPFPPPPPLVVLTRHFFGRVRSSFTLRRSDQHLLLPLFHVCC